MSIKSIVSGGPRLVTPEDPLIVNQNEAKYGHVKLDGGHIYTTVKTTAVFETLENEEPTPLTIGEQVIGDVLVLGNTGKSGENRGEQPRAANGPKGKDCACNWAAGCDSCDDGTNGYPGLPGEWGEDGADGQEAFPATFKIDELINQVDTINIPVPIPDEEGSSLIIKTMKRMMEFKGFISNKEFELLLEKLSKKTVEVNL